MMDSVEHENVGGFGGEDGCGGKGERLVAVERGLGIDLMERVDLGKEGGERGQCEASFSEMVRV